MKNKLLKPIIIGAMAIGLVACNNANNESSTASSTINTDAEEIAIEQEENQNTSTDKQISEKNPKPVKETIEVSKNDENKSKDNSSKAKENKEDKEETIEEAEKSTEDSDKVYDKDGKYFSSLIAEKKGEEDENIGPTTYNIKFDGDNLIVSGSIEYIEDPSDYDNQRDKLANKEDHTFKTNENTVFQAVGGMADPKIFDKEEFIKWYEQVSDSGLGLIIIVKDGLVESVSISS